MPHCNQAVLTKDEELEQESDVLLGPLSRLPYPRKVPFFERKCLRYIPWCINGVLVLALVGLLLQLPSQRQRNCSRYDPSMRAWDLAPEVVEYHHQQFLGNPGESSPYQGWPNKEKDKLWSDSYALGLTLHVDQSTAEKIGRRTEQVPIEKFKDDYLVGLDVFHQLHCLNVLRKGFYPKRYNMSLTNPDGKVDYGKWIHIDHCVESIRQYLVCHADTAAITYDWMPTFILQPNLGTIHTCRDFDKIRKWAFDRHVDELNLEHRVEDGKIVDYTKGTSKSGVFIEAEIPKDFHYTIDDM